MNARRFLAPLAAACTVAWANAAMSQQVGHSYSMPAAGTIEVGFSPNEGGEHLVLKVIDSATPPEVRIVVASIESKTQGR